MSNNGSTEKPTPAYRVYYGRLETRNMKDLRYGWFRSEEEAVNMKIKSHLDNIAIHKDDLKDLRQLKRDLKESKK